MDTAAKMTVIRNQKGIALVYLAIGLVALCGFLGLAIDVGHLQLVKGELQNAADATALAGAAQLYSGNPATLDFSRARSAATAFIGENKAGGVTLSTGTIDVGYWNLTRKALPLDPPTIVPVTGVHVPAVAATISRAEGSNGGRVPTFFARVIDMTRFGQVAVSSRPSVAMTGFSGSASPGDLFPMALSSCMTDQYFSQNPLPDPPTLITISSLYTPGGSDCFTGQWTSFQVEEQINATPTIRDLITNGNGTPLQTGDDIWIQPGEKNTLFNFVDNWLPDGGKDVLMAIVDGNTGSITTHATMEIKGFARFHIERAINGSNPSIQGYFVAYYETYPGSTPGGSVSNLPAPPVMVQ